MSFCAFGYTAFPIITLADRWEIDILINARLKISIITAVYNREKTIGTSLSSLAQQQYPHIEHIIQDGRSTDGTLQVIKSMQTHNTRLWSESDAGIYDALNRGISHATGDIIGFLHSDDTLAHGNVLSSVASRFADPQIDGVYGDLDYVSHENARYIIRRWRSGAFDPRLLKWGWMPPHPTLFLRRRVYEEFGGFDTQFRIASDYEAMLRYLVVGGISLSYIQDVLVKMRLGGESNRSLERIVLKTREDLKALHRHKVGGVLTLAVKNLRKISQFL